MCCFFLVTQFANEVAEMFLDFIKKLLKGKLFQCSILFNVFLFCRKGKMGFRKRLGLVKGKLLLVWLYVAKVWFSLVPRIFRFVNLFWPKEVTPPIEDDILLQSATSLAAKIRSREVRKLNFLSISLQKKSKCVFYRGS